jgi:hypothetical protein
LPLAPFLCPQKTTPTAPKNQKTLDSGRGRDRRLTSLPSTAPKLEPPAHRASWTVAETDFHRGGLFLGDSSRAIGAEIGMSNTTVLRARKATASHEAVGASRVGIDNKTRRLPGTPTWTSLHLRFPVKTYAARSEALRN